jgi:ribosome-associated toxin RatA of RatAB toxin-antitoxin module
MKRIRHSVLVPYGSREMFDLVDRIEHYPQFLPWCSGASVRDDGAMGRLARLEIDYHGIRAHFTTSNTNVAGESFRHLHGEWRFRGLAEAASKVEFELAYELASGIFERAVGPVFDHIASTFVDAFVRRASGVYGPR